MYGSYEERERFERIAKLCRKGEKKLVQFGFVWFFVSELLSHGKGYGKG